MRRHPHIFGDAAEQPRLGSAEGGRARRAGGDDSALAGVALALPALKRAEKIQRRAARVGFDWPDAAGPRAKIDEELAEIDAPRPTRSAPPRSATCCSPSSTMPATSTSTRKPRCAKPPQRFEQRFRKVEELADKPLERDGYRRAGSALAAGEEAASKLLTSSVRDAGTS